MVLWSQSRGVVFSACLPRDCQACIMSTGPCHRGVGPCACGSAPTLDLGIDGESYVPHAAIKQLSITFSSTRIETFELVKFCAHCSVSDSIHLQLEYKTCTLNPHIQREIQIVKLYTFCGG
jgi:hypothetical protein